MSTVAQHIALLHTKVDEIANGAALRIAAMTITAKMGIRIFENGLNADGSKIGRYSTKLMLATQKQFIIPGAFKASPASLGIAFGQNIKTQKLKTFRNKETNRSLWIAFPNRKTGGKNKAVPVMILPGGYTQFRTLNGRQAGFVDFRFRGDMYSDFRSSTTQAGEAYIAGFKRGENSKKYFGLTKRFGNKMVEVSPEESKEFMRIIREENKQFNA